MPDSELVHFDLKLQNGKELHVFPEIRVAANSYSSHW